MRRSAERGVAVVTAILVVAVAASTAAWMLAQQSATLNQTALVASRAQADLFAQAGLDWARGILAEDARSGTVDSLDEAWARPLAGLPVERALVSGAISDQQARYNLNNLVKEGRRSDADVQILTRLLDSLGLDPGLALAVLDWVDGDGDIAGNGGAEDAYYLSLPRPYRAANRPMAQVEELYAIRGFDAKAVARLRPFVTALPVRTAVNANTAPAEVIAAILPELGREAVRDLVASRQAKPFKDRADLKARAQKGSANAFDADLDVKSDHFLVQVGVAQDDVQVAAEALVARAAPGKSPATAIIWRRSLY
ncbi:MAG: general secretion pathway protein GspK [Betaproteobacteria bacterium]|nr:general secretion pathway protein GspK [Betaproteobacteria bacterium]PWB64005.1 MAG: general secretion pathway protein GspK [Betaproteobacteria bacterium]